MIIVMMIMALMILVIIYSLHIMLWEQRFFICYNVSWFSYWYLGNKGGKMTKLRDIIEDIITEENMDLTVREVIKHALQNLHDADGLYVDEGTLQCGCDIDNLFPCGDTQELDCKLRPIKEVEDEA